MTSESGLFMAGGKTGVLLLHDVGGSAGDLRSLAHAFASAGYTVCCPELADRSGGGTQQGPNGPGLWLSQADQAVFRLKAECDSIVAVGCGYGAILGIEVARSSPDVIQALVLVDPRAWLPAWSGQLASALAARVPQLWIARVASLLPGRKVSRGASVAPSFAQLSATNGEPELQSDLVMQIALLLDSAWAALPSIRQPVLLVQKQTTRRAGLASAAPLQRQLAGRVESVVLDDGNLGRGTSQLAEAIAERSQRFIAAVTDEVATRRSNEIRRQRVATRTSAA